MAHFNKRHYEAIALVMQSTHPTKYGWEQTTANHQWNSSVDNLADMFRKDNPLFNRDRFLCACLPGANVKAKTAHLKAV